MSDDIIEARPLFQCVCNSQWFTIDACFSAHDEAGVIYEVAGHSSDITCAKCGEEYNLARIAMGPDAYDARMAEIDEIVGAVGTEIEEPPRPSPADDDTRDSGE